jgi:hypothetical protein
MKVLLFSYCPRPVSSQMTIKNPLLDQNPLAGATHYFPGDSFYLEPYYKDTKENDEVKHCWLPSLLEYSPQHHAEEQHK